MSTTTGRVKWFDAKKGFGFIEQESGDKDIFVHASAVKSAGLRRLQEDDKVSFDVEDSPKGPNAINIKVVEEAEEKKE